MYKKQQLYFGIFLKRKPVEPYAALVAVALPRNAPFAAE